LEELIVLFPSLPDPHLNLARAVLPARTEARHRLRVREAYAHDQDLQTHEDKEDGERQHNGTIRRRVVAAKQVRPQLAVAVRSRLCARHRGREGELPPKRCLGIQGGFPRGARRHLLAGRRWPTHSVRRRQRSRVQCGFKNTGKRGLCQRACERVRGRHAPCIAMTRVQIVPRVRVVTRRARRLRAGAAITDHL